MRAIMLAAGCCLFLSAQAGTIYKCSEAGRTVYREQPCAGTGSVLAVPPAPAPDPASAARQERARALVADIDARKADESALAERDARDAARRQQREAQERERHCSRLRVKHQADAERDGRAIARARGPAKDWAERQARDNDRQRAQAMKAECPA